MSKKNKKGLVLDSSLQTFFFDKLIEINQRSSNPLPPELVFYASLIMDRYALSNDLFEKNPEGKTQEKILGIKLLESSNLPSKQRKSELKDIGDTSLFITGFFSESFNRKLVDSSYYQQIGASAYNRLNQLVPTHYDVNEFFKLVAKMFTSIMQLIAILAGQLRSNEDAIPFLITNGSKAA